MQRKVITIALSILMTGCMMFMKAPSNQEAYARTQVSEHQLYRVSFTPAESIRVGKLHSWTIAVADADSSPQSSAKITVDGGMPQHGHGLPTKPVVTNALGDGKYLVEGMKFNMGGWWVVKMTIAGAKGSDVVTFNLKL